VKLDLVQPSLRREWHLTRDDEVVATLWIPLFRRGANAEVAGHRLAIKRAGGLRTAYVVTDEAIGELQAGFRPQRLGHVLELGDRTSDWRHLGWGKAYGFVGPDGEPWLRAKVSSGIARTNGEVDVADDLPEHDALIAALLASFLLIRKTEEQAAASSTAATG